MTSTQTEEDLDALIEAVVAASKVPAKSRSANIKPTVASLTSLAYDRGLLPDALSRLVDLVTTPGHLDQASLAAIIRNLYPATRVSRDVVLRIVGAIGFGKLKPSLTLQAALLKWLIMIYHALDAQAALSEAYAILFNLLDTAAIRPNLTHLLALVTRRKHVKPFRIQALMNLSRQTGNDPCLVGLLRVFKDYYPEIIVGEAVRGKASAFKYPDQLWRERLHDIQTAHAQLADESAASRDGFRVNRPLGRTARNKTLPAVHTSEATEHSVTLEEVENVTTFVNNIEKIELPNQLVAVLADPLLQKLLLLRPSAEAHQRVSNWLSSVLQNVIDGDTDEATLWEVLDIVKDFVIQSKSIPPTVLEFFAHFFPLWSGSGRQDCVFAILPYAPLLDFQELYRHIFQPLEAAVLDNSPDSLVRLLTMYTNLLQHWTATLQSSTSVPSHASASLTAFIRHGGQLGLTAIQASPTATTDAAILLFYEQATHLVNDDVLKHFIRIELPPSEIIYTLLFSSSLATVSRLCSILACYKKGFEMAMSTKTKHDGSGRVDALSYDRAYVNLYNGYLMDICNCFWRARAFSDTDTNAHGCMVPRPVLAALSAYVTSVDKSFSLLSLFSLSHSPVLCLQSIQWVRELENAALEGGEATIHTRHAGPVTQSSLSKLSISGGLHITWQEYRIGVLKSLEANKLGGIADLLKNTMTVLKNSMDGKSTPNTK